MENLIKIFFLGVLVNFHLQANTAKINYEDIFIDYINKFPRNEIKKSVIPNYTPPTYERFILTKDDIRKRNYPDYKPFLNKRLIKQEVGKIKRRCGRENPEFVITLNEYGFAN